MNIKLFDKNAKIPTKGSEYAAGYDLYAVIDQNTYIDGKILENTVTIPAHHTVLISTGVAMEIPQGYWGGIYARSGLATKQGLRPGNCVGN